MTKNLHLEHPEDMTLTGDRNVINWFQSVSDVSVKMDGAPAIVWGTDPENGRFFVGTKSVFNKVKIKTAYTSQDILTHYGHNEALVEILLTCLDFLPRTEGIYQGDFIGFGGESAYKPNTIVYDFGQDIDAQCIIAPHTIYTGESLKTAVASPLLDVLDSTDDVLFVQPTVDSTHRIDDTSIEILEALYEDAEFLNEKEAKECKIIINSFIREGKELTLDILGLILGCDVLAELYMNVMTLKGGMMEGMLVYDGPTAFAGGEPIVAEGFVRSNKYGTIKLVDRYVFSRLNFNNTTFA